MINDFIKAENKGRAKFSKVVSQNPNIYGLEFTAGTYDNIDAYFYYKGGKYAVEIKDRYSFYSSWNIELLKYSVMKNKIENGEINGGYFAVFYNDTCYLYDFNTIQYCFDKYNVSDMRAKKTTMRDSDYTIKKVITLPIELAKIIKI